MDSRLFRYPLEVMKEKKAAIQRGTEKKEDLKYVLYSAHDSTVANFLEFLNLADFDFDNIPYAS